MKTYEYSGFTTDGRGTKGLVEAESVKDAREKLQYDLYYVKNFSIFLDLLILLQTAEVVLLGKGAH